MAKIRHIAYRTTDVEAMADFFCRGLGLAVVQRRESGVVDLSDGTLNVSLLPAALRANDGEPPLGIAHIGFTVADEDAAGEALVAAGGQRLNTIRTGDAHYEVKFQGPDGIIVDLGHWVGTAPIGEESATGTRP